MAGSEKVELGVGIILQNSQGEILMMRRKSAHGQGSYSIPGGSVDAGEGIQSAALRELEEETGLQAANLVFLGVTNNLKTFKKEGRHVASIIFYSSVFTGTLALKEPEKHDLLGWYALQALPSPLFEASELALELLHSVPTSFYDTSLNLLKEPT
ncbi:nucleotide triphosphate diphosphatase NUDT15 [Alteromonas sp. a30]|uniref:nucleotide triphosphate diphosphatase NUDT15 n=1 Tax=Alteromonas sp. a30 TaxID=2730917 RepID=UPI0022805720|nr:NUDIX domain-containing protein [Alteromonas sp. a30]MCY7293995.1 NUDIX domain-containing protein [Alteromonas sp. a30]